MYSIAFGHQTIHPLTPWIRCILRPLIVDGKHLSTLRLHMDSSAVEVRFGDDQWITTKLDKPCLTTPFAIHLALSSKLGTRVQGWILKTEIGETNFRRLSRWVYHQR